MTIIKTFDTTDENPINPLAKRLIIAAGIFLLCLLIIKIWVSNVMVEYGRQLEKISTTQNAIRLESQILENEIYRRSSLSEIATKSPELGFFNPEHLQYIH